MNRVARSILIAATLALPLGGCGSMPEFDPLDWISGDPFGTKKPLPGERKALFPEGVPGVARGVPPEVMKGNQALAGGDDAPQDAAVQIDEPKPKAKAKPKPKTAAKPAPAPAAPRSTAANARRPEPPPPQQQQQQQPSAGEWPEPPPAQSHAPSAVQWPDPPPVR